MNPNSEAVYREFPFLEKFFSKKEKIKKVRVSRITNEFLDQKSAWIFNDGEDWPSTQSYGKILLLDQKGQLLTQVGVKSVKIWKFSFRKKFIESVGQALIRLGREASVYYAVWLDNHGELTVYKPPKDFTFQSWYEKQIKLSVESIRNKV
jgi:hypothetical protein